LALADGRSAVKLDAEWAKGWVRVGAASLALHRYTDARESYERALALDEGNEQISKYVKEAKEAEESSLAAGKFVFCMDSSKRKRKTEDSSSAVPAGKRVQDKKLLSFDDDA
jgi:tetratricopeptide (TPR) repeat protein